MYKKRTGTRHLTIFRHHDRQYSEPEHTIPIQPQKRALDLYLCTTHATVTLESQPTPQDYSNQNNTPSDSHVQYAVSDGSVAHGKGTYGWVQATKKKILQSSMGQVTGIPGNITSFRAEAQGLANLIYNSTINNKTKIYLDNEAVIEKLILKNRCTQCNQSGNYLNLYNNKLNKETSPYNLSKDTKT